MRRNRIVVAALLSLAFILTAAAFAPAQGFKDLQGKVVEKTLPNGLKLIILPRTGAPTVSMVTYADVGSVDEVNGRSGLAHVFEHMAFKGTTTVGTLDFAKEQEAMKKEDEAFLAWREEKMRYPRPDATRLAELEKTLKAAQDEARKFVKANEIGEIIEREGGQGLNAFTSFDQTVYLYSLPSNKLELWAALESDRFTNPVIREFYKEKDVIIEELRMGDSQPVSRLVQDFLAVAYRAHPYRSMVIGELSDLQALRRSDAENWFRRFYGAKNLTTVVVGDVDPVKVLPMLEKHLGRIPPGEKPGRVVTDEPAQRSEKRIMMTDPSQPFLVIAYHRPDINDPAYAAMEALADILGNGRSSRLNKVLVKEKKYALAVQCLQLGEKYPGIFGIIAVPNQGHTNVECEGIIYDELEKIKNEKVTDAELAGYKARNRSRFLSQLDSNMGLAMGLARAQNLHGDWRKLFARLDETNKLTAEDLQEAARKIFIPTNRTVGEILTENPDTGLAQ